MRSRSSELWRLLGLSLLLAVALVAHALADFSGQVVGITDGDTISVMHDGEAEKIRLNGIDCPEKGQPFGRRAKQYASDLAFDQIVTVEEFGKDRYGRTIGDVTLPDGRLLNEELVKVGLAWWYRKCALANLALQNLEDEAGRTSAASGVMQT